MGPRTRNYQTTVTDTGETRTTLLRVRETTGGDTWTGPLRAPRPRREADAGGNVLFERGPQTDRNKESGLSLRPQGLRRNVCFVGTWRIPSPTPSGGPGRPTITHTCRRVEKPMLGLVQPPVSRLRPEAPGKADEGPSLLRTTGARWVGATTVDSP